MRRAVGVLGCVALGLGLFPGAQAVADDDAPSAGEVRSAQQEVTDRAAEVGRIRAELAEADRRVDDLAIRAARAGEASNGARYRVSQARREVRRTAKRAEVARGHAQQQRAEVARLTVADVQSGTSARRMTALLSIDGPRRLLERQGAYDSAGDATTAALAGYESAATVARTYTREARAAVTAQERLARRALRAEQQARAAVSASEEAAGSLRSDKDALVRRLARAQGVSVALAARRQADLEQQAAARQARRERQRDREQPAQAADAPDPASSQPDPAPAPDPDPAPRPDPQPDPGPRPDPEPEPDPPADPPRDPRPSSGVEAAIDYARAQLGEPYVWGAAGPGSWDCSGLTMKAWAAGGERLPHFSGGQYEASTPVAVSRARRGDLLFWSDGGPSSIYHVALYLGDGRMIHAPRPGKGVEIVSVGSWIAPDLAARVG